MTSKKLLYARNYERENSEKIPKEQRPLFHLTPYTGWMNDPNGFSFYNNKYHLFYQYNPYDTKWDSMHWGHAVSNDMLRWEYLPAVLAPDAEYDSSGCFSGSAVELPNGKQLLMYTGVHKEKGVKKELQTQCIAVGNGLDYEKYPLNPVLSAESLPKGLSPYDFRDPKIWKDNDDSYKCVVGAYKENRNGAVLLFSSDDALKWNFCGTLAESDNKSGKMWECPDFFELGDKNVLVLSSQDMKADGYKDFDKNGVFYMLGKYTESSNNFSIEYSAPVDYGKDFYAPQTAVMPDGRRVMVGWLQNWSTVSKYRNKDFKWIGQMSLPRELFIDKGKLFQKPISELKRYRCEKVQRDNVSVCGDISFQGINGRTIDLELTIRPKDKNNIFDSFTIKFAQSANSYASLNFYPKRSLLKYKAVYQSDMPMKNDEQKCYLISNDSVLRLRIILDKYSAEIFINSGEQVLSSVLLNEPEADGISFNSDKEAILDITKYTLR